MKTRLVTGLAVVDKYIIVKLEAFSHWTQRTYGITATTWQRLCLTAYSVLAIHLSLSFLLIWSFLGFVQSFQRTNKNESEVIASNPLKSKDEPFRAGLVFLILFIPCLRTAVTMADILCVSWMLAWYFSILDDLPKQRSRLREFISSITTKPLATVDGKS